jgi:hypothetical protein
MSKCVKKKNQQVELLIFNYVFSPVLGWPNGLYPISQIKIYIDASDFSGVVMFYTPVDSEW